MLGSKFSKEKLVSIHIDMDFEVTKNSASTYTDEIMEFELKRAAESGVSVIDFSRKLIESIPMTISTVVPLRKLCLNECKIKNLPGSERLTTLSSLLTVELRGNQFSVFPRCFALPTVESLILDHNAITTVPEDDLLGMTGLRTLSMFANKLKSFPACVTTMHSLQKLDLECNYIKALDFDQASLPGGFQLSIDPMVKTPSTGGLSGTPKGAARKANATPKSSGSKARSPKAAGPTSPRSPSASSSKPRAKASASAKRKSTDPIPDLSDEEDGDYKHRAKRSKTKVE